MAASRFNSNIKIESTYVFGNRCPKIGWLEVATLFARCSPSRTRAKRAINSKQPAARRAKMKKREGWRYILGKGRHRAQGVHVAIALTFPKPHLDQGGT